MIRTLLLRLEGPMQSWGTQSRFRDRDSGAEPSKSGVVGLLCAALGRPRSAPVADLAALRMGVRVDRPGVVRVDYQTAGGTHRASERYGVARAENPGTETSVSRRSYLSDAAYLVGLEADTPERVALLSELDRALSTPVWPLFLGRKGYVPSCPVRLPDAPPDGPGLRDGALEEVLAAYPWDPRASEERARLVIEVPAGASSAEARNDWPLSFEPLDRHYATRYVVTSFLPRPSIAPAGQQGR